MARKHRKSGASNAEDNPQRSLIDAIHEGDLAKVQEVLRNKPAKGVGPDPLGLALSISCHSGQVEIVDFLLRHQVDPDFAPANASPPLFRAIEYCDCGSEARERSHVGHRTSPTARHAAGKKIIELLVHHGADIDIEDRLKRSPLMVTKSDDIAELLIRKGANLEKRDKQGQTLLLHTKSEHTIEILIENGADLEARDQKGRTILMLTKSERIADLLIQNGANIEARDSDGRTVLMYAVWKQHLRTLHTLLRHGADVGKRDKRSRNIWHHLTMDTARQWGPDDDELMRILLNTAADTEASDETMRKPLHWAAAKGNTTPVAFLLDQQRASLSCLEHRDKTPLHLAVSHNQLGVARLLIDRGADIHAESDGGWSVLLTACTSAEDPVEVVDFLLKNGAAISQRPVNGGWTALHVAAEHNTGPKTVALLMNKGIGVNSEADMCWTPLHCACRAMSASIAIVDTLLSRGAQLNCRTNGGKTPLQLAAESGNHDLVAHLLKRPDIHTSAKDNFGNNPLLAAALADEPRIVSLFAPWSHSRVAKMTADAQDAARRFNATIVDMNFGSKKNPTKKLSPTIFDLLYTEHDGDAKSKAKLQCKAPSDLRWIHLPANNTQWCRDLLTKYFIENGARGGLVQEYKALEISLSQQHHGQQPHSNYMRPLCQVIPRAKGLSSPQVSDSDGGMQLSGVTMTASTAVEISDSEAATLVPPRRRSTDVDAGSFMDGRISSSESRTTTGLHPSPQGLRIVESPDQTPQGNQSRARRRTKQRSPMPSSKLQPPPAQAYVFMPYLHFELEKGRQEMGNAVKHVWRTLAHDDGPVVAPPPAGQISINLPPHSQQPAKEWNKDETLIRAHLKRKNTSLHIRRTLDQFFYRNVDTSFRDTDQVIFRYQKKLHKTVESEKLYTNSAARRSNISLRAKSRNTTSEPAKAKIDTSGFKVLMVDQLWMWILGKDLVISSFPQRWAQPERDPYNIVSSVLDELYSNTHEPVKNAYELATLISGHCFDAFDRHNDRTSDIRFLDMFEAAIGDAMDEEALLFDEFTSDSEEASKWLKIKQPGEAPAFVERLLDIGRETELLREVKDIRGELEMLRLVFQQQQVVLDEMYRACKSMRMAGAQNHVVAREHIVRELGRMDGQAERIYVSLKDLLDLKQKQANAIEARYARDQAAGTERQGDITLVFTAVTVIFLPISFIAAFFAIPLAEFPHDDTGNVVVSTHQASGYVFGLGLSISTVCLIIAAFKDTLASKFPSLTSISLFGHRFFRRKQEVREPLGKEPVATPAAERFEMRRIALRTSSRSRDVEAQWSPVHLAGRRTL